jgi:hypothetical protein
LNVQLIIDLILAINVTTQCSEIDAFCQVKNVSKDGKIVMKEGENQVIVQVDAADQSKSIYTIKVIKPSGKILLNEKAQMYH